GERGFEGGGVEETLRILLASRERGVHAGRIRTVEQAARVGRIQSVGDGHGEAGLQGQNTAQLPTARDVVNDGILDIDGAAFAERQVPKSAGDEAVARVVARAPLLTTAAIAVLREQG